MVDLTSRRDAFENRFAHEEMLRGQNSKQELDRRLDLALEETFPASDPVSVIIAF